MLHLVDLEYHLLDLELHPNSNLWISCHRALGRLSIADRDCPTIIRLHGYPMVLFMNLKPQADKCKTQFN